jgi:hypothetical protein
MADAESDRWEYVKRAYEAADTFSSQASDNARKLAFVGLGLVLLLGGVAKEDFGGDKAVDLSTGLITAGVALTAALLLDMLQYTYGWIAYYWWGRREEKRLRRSADATPKESWPRQLNWPTTVFFGGKVLGVIVGYSILLWYLAYAVK